MNDFVIDKISWYLNKGISHDVQLKFRALLGFLKENNLLCDNYDYPGEELPEQFELRSSHLTEEGLLLIKKSYHKWLKSIDKGKSESDVSFLAKELKKLRSS